MKTCTKCKKELPATTEYFHRHSTCKGGLNSICKKCFNSYYRKSYKEGRFKSKCKEKKSNLNIELTPMVKTTPYSESPKNALSKDEIQKKKYKNNAIYLVIYKPDGRGGHKPIAFKGKLIHQTKDFITLQNKNGIRESFLKVDFMIGTQIKEVN